MEELLLFNKKNTKKVNKERKMNFDQKRLHFELKLNNKIKIIFVFQLKVKRINVKFCYAFQMVSPVDTNMIIVNSMEFAPITKN